MRAVVEGLFAVALGALLAPVYVWAVLKAAFHGYKEEA
mgnify:CR=1 FL=1